MKVYSGDDIGQDNKERLWIPLKVATLLVTELLTQTLYCSIYNSPL